MLSERDGYLLDVQRPYFSNTANNDARVMLNEVEKEINGMREWIQAGDIFVLDHGYRDAVKYLEQIGINVEMPSFLEEGQQQRRTNHCKKTQDSNEFKTTTTKSGHNRYHVNSFSIQT